MRSARSRLVAGALIVMVGFLAPQDVRAQDFLFDRPDVTITLFGGMVGPAEGSDIFDYTREDFTVERGDFRSVGGAAEVAWRVNEHLDLGLGLEHTARTVDSEIRDFVTIDDQPIPQSTRLAQTRFMATARGYLLSRGRRVSSFAWVPNRWSPYVGAGVGVTGYEFEQSGDFVAYDTHEIFEDELAAQGAGFSAHGLAGLQLSLTPRLLLRGEYQYVWGDAALGENRWGATDYEGFGDIDLSGWRALIGVSVRI